MKLVIDIPDEDYRFIKDLQHVILNRGTTKKVQYDVLNAIKNGIPYELMAMPIKVESHDIDYRKYAFPFVETLNPNIVVRLENDK